LTSAPVQAKVRLKYEHVVRATTYIYNLYIPIEAL
jgi:hypothetical protein